MQDTKHFSSRSMHFTLNITLRVFTKLTKTVTFKLMTQLINVLFYLDEWLRSAPTQEEETKVAKDIITMIHSLGFFVNFFTSQLVP